jgi:hypothetical protein
VSQDHCEPLTHGPQHWGQPGGVALSPVGWLAKGEAQQGVRHWATAPYGVVSERHLAAGPWGTQGTLRTSQTWASTLEACWVL